jgi:hypothetical protein
MRRAVVPLLVIVIGAVALAFWSRGKSGNPSPPDAPLVTEEPVPKIKDRSDDQDAELSHVVACYRPTTQARIDDSGTAVVDLLRGLPGVVRVEVGVRTDQPTCRIVHLRDWHFVPKDLYALDMKTATGRELTGEEIDRLHQRASATGRGGTA